MTPYLIVIIIWLWIVGGVFCVGHTKANDPKLFKVERPNLLALIMCIMWPFAVTHGIFNQKQIKK